MITGEGTMSVLLRITLTMRDIILYGLCVLFDIITLFFVQIACIDGIRETLVRLRGTHDKPGAE